jgi:hypothetical protein
MKQRKEESMSAVNLDDARRVISAAEKKAREIGQPMTSKHDSIFRVARRLVEEGVEGPNSPVLEDRDVHTCDNRRSSNVSGQDRGLRGQALPREIQIQERLGEYARPSR